LDLRADAAFRPSSSHAEVYSLDPTTLSPSAAACFNSCSQNIAEHHRFISSKCASSLDQDSCSTGISRRASILNRIDDDWNAITATLVAAVSPQEASQLDHTTVLEAYFADNIHYPFPCDTTLTHLSQSSHMSVADVNAWLAQKRAQFAAEMFFDV
jgi:hypothetical protein